MEARAPPLYDLPAFMNNPTANQSSTFLTLETHNHLMDVAPIFIVFCFCGLFFPFISLSLQLDPRNSEKGQSQYEREGYNNVKLFTKEKKIQRLLEQQIFHL